mgnify:CR=1 FL=1
MYGLGVNRLGVTNTNQFNPATFFTDGTQGAWYDMSDRSSMFKVDGTTPAVEGEPVEGAVSKLIGSIKDQFKKNQFYIEYSGLTSIQSSPIFDVVSDDNNKALT